MKPRQDNTTPKQSLTKPRTETDYKRDDELTEIERIKEENRKSTNQTQLKPISEPSLVTVQSRYCSSNSKSNCRETQSKVAAKRKMSFVHNSYFKKLNNVWYVLIILKFPLNKIIILKFISIVI